MFRTRKVMLVGDDTTQQAKRMMIGGEPQLRLARLRPSGIQVSLSIVAAVAAAAAARELASILVPLVIAIFAMIMVEMIARAIRAKAPFVPRWLALGSGSLLLAASLVGAVWAVGAYAAALAGQASIVSARIDALLADLAHRSGTAPLTVDRLVGEADLRGLLGGLQGFASGALFVAIYLGFLVASRHSLTRKFGRLFAADGARPHARRVLVSVRDATEQYVWVQTVTGIAIAGASWALMAAVGQSNAPLLALIIFLTSYIPMIGPFLGVIVPPLVGLVEFEGLGRPLILLVGLQAINFAVNNVIVPRMQSDRLNLDPIVVLLSLGFWGWLWGLPGVFLSTPLTALVMAVAAELPHGRWFAVLLSKDGQPVPPHQHSDIH